MKEIPRLNIPVAENCFFCGIKNEQGLRLTFYLDEDQIVVPVTIPKHLVGWGDVVHGGIVAGLLDEAASWCVAKILENLHFATIQLAVKYKKPLRAGVPMTVRAKIVNQRFNIVDCEAWIAEQEGKRVCSTADVRIALIDEDKFNSFATG